MKKTVCYITGTSTGIGKAITSKLLNEQVRVYGYGRKCTIKHAFYTHRELDLRDLSALIGFDFPGADDAERIILINNAGTLGEIKPVGLLDELSLPEIIQVNTTAPAMLMNSFIRTFGNQHKELIILNISSGAAKFPVPGWSGYCSSKAALDMFSEVVALENRHNQVRIHAIAPGIVETPMQEKIRATSAADFERVDDFIGYKKRGELSDPAEVALRIWKLINEPSTGEVCISFRD